MASSTLVSRVLTERGWQELADQRGHPCACDGDREAGRLCLGHYGLLDPGRQARARRQAGVSEMYLGDRRR
jgi:hypothetical protein